jgi:hypothetical protein
MLYVAINLLNSDVMLGTIRGSGTVVVETREYREGRLVHMDLSIDYLPSHFLENSMIIEEIKAFEFTYIPFNQNFPISKCVFTIVAKNRKEAELIALSNDYKFCDQDHTVSVKEILQGYREVK